MSASQPGDAAQKDGKEARNPVLPVLTSKIVADAIRKNAGILSAAASQLGTTRQNVWSWCQRSPECRQAQEEAKAMTLDLAEGNLLQMIRSSNLGAVIFYLKCHGKERGYVERQEVTGPGGGPVQTIDLTKLTDDELRNLEATLARAAVAADRQGDGGA